MKSVFIVGPRTGCGYTTAARDFLKTKRIAFKNIYIQMSDLENTGKLLYSLKVTKKRRITAPIIFVNGKYIGGYSDLIKM